jgi:hypothetical protein
MIVRRLWRCDGISSLIGAISLSLTGFPGARGKETRYPGFYYQADYPGQDDENWFCFVNSKYDPKEQKWDIFKKDYIKIIPDA